MRRLGPLLCLAALSCAGDVCNQLGALDWPRLQGPCADAGAPPPGGPTCEQEMSACSSSDRSTLTGYLGCLQNLPACTTANAADWPQALAQCQALRQTLSPTCPFYVTAGSAEVGRSGGDGGCRVNDDCAPVQCPCTDEDGGSPFQQCTPQGCATTCPELFCCAGLGLGSGAQCNSPCDCVSSVCAAGSCS